MNAELKKGTKLETTKRLIKDLFNSRKPKQNNSNSNSNEIDPMEDLDKEKASQKQVSEDETIEIESENVKVAKIPGSKLMKVYYWKKENVTFLAAGHVGIEKREGDQTKQIQKEYSQIGTDQLLKITAAIIETQNKPIKK